MLALDVGEDVAHLDGVSGRRVPLLVVPRLLSPTHRVDVVAAGVLGVDRAGGTVIIGAVEGVLVEALLGGGTVGVTHFVGIADEELAMTLFGR